MASQNRQLKILVFHKTLFSLSETFIARQVQGLTGKFNLVLLASKYEVNDVLNPEAYSKYSIPDRPQALDKILTALTRRFFSKNLSFSLFTTFRLNYLLKKESVGLIHAHYGWSGLRILQLAKKRNIPLIVSFHGKDASAALRQESYRSKLPELFEYASAIIICSPHMRDTLPVQRWLHKVKLIPYGVALADLPSKPSVNDEARVKILHAGRIASKKGVPDLIRVFSRLVKHYDFIELHILGGGEELEECIALAETEGIQDRVRFYGPQPYSVVQKQMEECDMFVLNSRTDADGDMEGLPNTLLEAMCLGKAVVSTIHAGIPQAVVTEYNGLLVPERNNEELFHAIARLINDKDLRKTLGINARQTVIDKFLIERMQEQLIAVIQSVTNN